MISMPILDISLFGAWCDRQYGFVYDGVRAHGGVAWFPVLSSGDRIDWRANSSYRTSHLQVHPARAYPELELASNCDMYRQFVDAPDSLMWVSDPARKKLLWNSFVPWPSQSAPLSFTALLS
jgi:glucose-6-phosphate isomerase